MMGQEGGVSAMPIHKAVRACEGYVSKPTEGNSGTT